MNRATSLSFSGSSRLGLLIAALLAVVTGALVFAAIRSQESAEPAVVSATGGSTRTVVTAKQDISARTEITGDMLQVTEIPAGALLAGAYGSSDLVVGRVAAVPIVKGEQFVEGKLTSAKAPVGLPYIVPKDLRAMAVKADKVVGAGGLIRPGDRVDVYGVVEVSFESLSTGKSFKDTRSIVIAQDVQVLAVEQKIATKPTSSAQGDTSSDRTEAVADQPDAQPDATVVTLALTPQQAQDVLLIEFKGVIRLAVRAPGDTATTEMVDRTYLSLSDAEFQAFLKESLKDAR